MPKKTIKYLWRGKMVERAVLSKAATAAKTAKFKATRAKHKGAKGVAEMTRTKARRATLQALGPARSAPPAVHHVGKGRPHPAKGNGRADARVPDLEAVSIRLHRAQDWIIAAKYMGTLTDLDPAHREVIAALGDLEGVQPPF